MRVLKCCLLFIALFVFAASGLCAPGTELAGGTLYPRVLRLAHGGFGTAGRILASTTGHIFESTDDGATFHEIAVIEPKAGSKERCCATLYEVPQQVGSLAAGTLLYSASFFQDGVPAIEVYASTDTGRHWTYHSTVARRGDDKHGLWEPQFLLTSDGALAVFWSDETDPCCSQKLAQMRTRDGIVWQDAADTVATAVQSDRPGMVVTSTLGARKFLMTYEVCGAMHCAVFSRTSADGWNWGEPRDMGRLLRTAQGEYLEHAPTNTWLPDAPGSGVMLVSAQLLVKADGMVDPLRNGRVLFASRDPFGWDAWTQAEAPLDVPRAFDNYCPNYSSVLLPVRNGAALLELASDYNAAGMCRTYFSSVPLSTVIAEGLFTVPRHP